MHEGSCACVCVLFQPTASAALPPPSPAASPETPWRQAAGGYRDTAHHPLHRERDMYAHTERKRCSGQRAARVFALYCECVSVLYLCMRHGPTASSGGWCCNRDILWQHSPQPGSPCLQPRLHTNRHCATTQPARTPQLELARPLTINQEAVFVLHVCCGDGWAVLDIGQRRLDSR